jgi:hypothetical protein
MFKVKLTAGHRRTADDSGIVCDVMVPGPQTVITFRF